MARFLLVGTAAALIPGSLAASDHVLVADCQADTVVRFDRDGTFLGAFVSAGAGGMEFAHSMEWGPDGNGDGLADLYVVGADSAAIHRYDGRTGAPIGDGVFAAQLLFVPRDLLWGPDRGGDGFPDLHVLNGNSVYRVVWFHGNSGTVGGVFVNLIEDGSDWFFAESMDWGPDSTGDGVSELYGSSTESGVIYRYDGASGLFLDEFASGEPAMSACRELRVHGDGYLYVCNAPGDSIVRFDAVRGGAPTTFVAPGSGGLNLPHGIRFGPDANKDGIEDLYVAGEFNGAVTRHDGATGELIDVFAEQGIVAAAAVLFQAECPGDFDGDGAVGIADLLSLLAAWRGPGDADLDGDGRVGINDLLALLGRWGPCR